MPIPLAESVPQHRLMPLISADSVAQVVEDASIYRDAGLPYVEVLCRTGCAIDAIAATARQMPDLVVGAGTVLSLEMAERARKAGARFLVSPATDPVIMDYARRHGLDMVPGVYSPTDVAIALRHGFALQKLFPTEPGGITRLDAFASPYTHTGAKMICSHGVGKANTPAFLKHPLVAAIIADWLVPLRGAALREELAQTRAWLKTL
jgi:2-dehydro-3-deoxyphosphogluconate aldolase/(4S)-4-hydroxy-2-oxoglutarate aldolase